MHFSNSFFSEMTSSPSSLTFSTTSTGWIIYRIKKQLTKLLFHFYLSLALTLFRLDNIKTLNKALSKMDVTLTLSKIFWSCSTILFTQKKFKEKIAIRWDEGWSDSLFIYSKSALFNFIRPSPNSPNNSHNPSELCLITRLRLGLSHIKQYELKQNSQDSINPLCGCKNNIDSTEHFLPHCPQLVNENRFLLSTI